MIDKRSRYVDVIRDVSIASTILFVAGFLLAVLKPGLITSVIDLTTLFLGASVVLIADCALGGATGVLKPWQRRYVLIFFGINLFLISVGITLQTVTHLIGFTISALIIMIYLLVAYVVRDSGSAH